MTVNATGLRGSKTVCRGESKSRDLAIELVSGKVGTKHKYRKQTYIYHTTIAQLLLRQRAILPTSITLERTLVRGLKSLGQDFCHSSSRASRQVIRSVTNMSVTSNGDASTISQQPAKRQKLGGYDFYRSIGSPKWVIAPMVDQSELVGRCTGRKGS